MPEAKPEKPQETPEQKRDAWILQKCRDNFWSCQKAVKEHPDFAEALRLWKERRAKTAMMSMRDYDRYREEFLEVARKYIPCPDFSKDIPPKDKRTIIGPRVRIGPDVAIGGGRSSATGVAGSITVSKPEKPKLKAEADDGTS